LLHEVLPGKKVMALLLNPADLVVSDTNLRIMKATAGTFGVDLHVVYASSEREFDAVFTKIIEVQAGGLVIAPDFLFTGRMEQLGGLTARHAVPAIYKGREFAAAGGLMSYGSDIKESYRLAGIYVGRILKGEKPGDLPVQQATKVELHINLKTAKALGITFPLSLLGRADEVFE
jgi:putative tryptophan/tyrosine transport system substrate-binding protein